MKLEKMKRLALSISEHSWRFETKKPENGMTLKTGVITCGQFIFLSGVLTDREAEEKMKFCAESPTIVLHLIDLVNFWAEICLKFSNRASTDEAWIWKDAEEDFDKLKKRVEYAAERITDHA